MKVAGSPVALTIPTIASLGLLENQIGIGGRLSRRMPTGPQEYLTKRRCPRLFRLLEPLGTKHGDGDERAMDGFVAA